MPVTPLYAALLGLIFVVLSVRIVRLRRGLRVPLGDAGNQQLLRAISVHSNFAEYVPLALLLIYLLESQGANAALIHGLCVGLLFGRLSHAYGVSQTAEDYRFRVFGMVMTFTSIVASSTYLLFSYVKHRVD